jgi:hypothetical protein
MVWRTFPVDGSPAPGVDMVKKVTKNSTVVIMNPLTTVTPMDIIPTVTTATVTIVSSEYLLGGTDIMGEANFIAEDGIAGEAYITTTEIKRVTT